MLWLAGWAELRLDWLVKPPCVEQDMILKCYGLRAELRLSKGLLGPMCQPESVVYGFSRGVICSVLYSNYEALPTWCEVNPRVFQ